VNRDDTNEPNQTSTQHPSRTKHGFSWLAHDFFAVVHALKQSGRQAIFDESNTRVWEERQFDLVEKSSSNASTAGCRTTKPTPIQAQSTWETHELTSRSNPPGLISDGSALFLTYDYDYQKAVGRNQALSKSADRNRNKRGEMFSITSIGTQRNYAHAQPKRRSKQAAGSKSERSNQRHKSSSNASPAGYRTTKPTPSYS
jgi:hypothetical protein